MDDMIFFDRQTKFNKGRIVWKHYRNGRPELVILLTHETIVVNPCSFDEAIKSGEGTAYTVSPTGVLKASNQVLEIRQQDPETIPLWDYVDKSTGELIRNEEAKAYDLRWALSHLRTKDSEYEPDPIWCLVNSSSDFTGYVDLTNRFLIGRWGSEPFRLPFWTCRLDSTNVLRGLHEPVEGEFVHILMGSSNINTLILCETKKV